MASSRKDGSCGARNNKPSIAEIDAATVALGGVDPNGPEVSLYMLHESDNIRIKVMEGNVSFCLQEFGGTNVANSYFEKLVETVSRGIIDPVRRDTFRLAATTANPHTIRFSPCSFTIHRLLSTDGTTYVIRYCTSTCELWEKTKVLLEQLVALRKCAPKPE